MMYSRLILRSPFIVQRCFSLSSISQATATKLKEKTSESKVESTNQPIPPPTSTNLQDQNKTYSEQIHRLVNEISKLSLIDVMDLNDLLKKTLKIQDVPIMASTAASATPAPSQPKKDEDEDEAARPTAQSVFKVRLIKIDDTKKVPVIKQVKDVVENINLVQAKKLVESIPQVLRDNLSKADAEKMKAKIEAAGGICAIE